MKGWESMVQCPMCKEFFAELDSKTKLCELCSMAEKHGFVCSVNSRGVRRYTQKRERDIKALKIAEFLRENFEEMSVLQLANAVIEMAEE